MVGAVRAESFVDFASAFVPRNATLAAMHAAEDDPNKNQEERGRWGASFKLLGGHLDHFYPSCERSGREGRGALIS
jgi:hypothetical protein